MAFITFVTLYYHSSQSYFRRKANKKLDEICFSGQKQTKIYTLNKICNNFCKNTIFFHVLLIVILTCELKKLYKRYCNLSLLIIFSKYKKKEKVILIKSRLILKITADMVKE